MALASDFPIDCEITLYQRRFTLRYARSWYAALISVMPLLSCIVIVVGLAACNIPSTTLATPTPGSSLASTTPARPLLFFSAAVPGPCDRGRESFWRVGNVHPENKQDVPDHYTQFICRPDGILVSRINKYQFYGATFFYGPQTPFTTSPFSFSQHYRVQVEAQVINGDNNASVSLDVHCPEHYGCYQLEVRANSSWDVVRLTTDGEIDKRLSMGFLPHPTKHVVLAAEVHQSVMTFFINDKNVTMVNDATYPMTTSVSFGIADTSATSSPAALFSHFQYMPLSATMPTYVDPTATRTPYQANVPGFGCDHGSAQWAPSVTFDQNNNPVTMQCLSGGLKMSQPDGAKYIGAENFYWLNGNFPADYSVEAQIDVSNLQDGCAGFLTRRSEQGNYSFYVCQNGSWIVERYDTSAQKNQDLAHGFVDQRSSYHLVATSKGSMQELTIDGQQVASVTDQKYTTTDFLSLAVSTQHAGSAVFSHFVFTSLS